MHLERTLEIYMDGRPEKTFLNSDDNSVMTDDFSRSCLR